MVEGCAVPLRHTTCTQYTYLDQPNPCTCDWLFEFRELLFVTLPVHNKQFDW